MQRFPSTNFEVNYKSWEHKVKSWVQYDSSSENQRMDFQGTHRNRQQEVRDTAPVVLGVKDTINVDGFRCEMGTPIMRGYQPGNDARVVHNLRSNGVLIAGKTSCAEFAVHSTLTADLENPFGRHLLPGTSSTGSATCVAVNTAHAALATQTAASISRPAAYCGVLGFKPTFGLLPRTGILKTSDTLDTVGFMGRNCETIRNLLTYSKVQGPNYPFASCAEGTAKFAPRVGVLFEGLDFFRQYDPNTINDFLYLIGQLKRLADWPVELFSPPTTWNRAHEVHDTIYAWSLSYYLRREYGSQAIHFSPALKRLITEGNKISNNRYREALTSQTALKSEFAQVTRDFDFFVTPATAVSNPERGDRERPDFGLIATLLGVPALNIPFITPDAQLPRSVLIIGPHYADFELLRLGEWLTESVAAMREYNEWHDKTLALRPI